MSSDLAPPEITSKIEEIARFVSKYGLSMERRIMGSGSNVDNTRLCFLKSSDPYHALYKQKLGEYQKAEKDPVTFYDDIEPDPPLPLEPTLKELGVIKLTAQFLVRYGMHFWRDLLNRVINDPKFAFMDPTHMRFSVFSRLIDAYARVLKPYHHNEMKKLKKLKKPDAVLESFFNLLLEVEKEKQEEEGVEMHAFLAGLDYFADKEGQEQSSTIPMDPLCFPLIYPQGITPKELGIIKLTAQFVARYGLYFRLELMKKVVDDPQFEFMRRRRTDSYNLLSLLVGAYSIALVTLGNPKPGACLETVLEGFLNLFRVKEEGGMEMVMTGLHALVGEELSSPPGKMQCDAPATPAPFRLTLYPEGISFTFKELHVIKLTAQFVGVYGWCFEKELMKSVTKNPQFEFMKPADSRHGYFLDLALEYSKELPKVRKNSAATVVEGFFNILAQVLAKEDENGEELAFEYFVNDCQSEKADSKFGLVNVFLHCFFPRPRTSH